MRKMQKSVIATLIILFVTIIGQSTASVSAATTYTPAFEIASESAYLVDMKNDTLIYEKNSDKKLVQASLTKIMSAMIVLENVDDLEAVTTAPVSVFNEIAGLGASNAGIMAGEEVTIKDLLYSMVIKSACESASILANYVCDGNQQAFVDMMNQKAKDLGANDTLFVDPHGLDDTTQYSTAHDMYLITKYALSNELFKEISTLNKYTMAATNKHPKERTISHTNEMLLPGKSYYNKSVSGIKTGTTGLNTKNLISLGNHGDTEYMLVLLGAPDKDANQKFTYSTYKDTEALYNWVFKKFEMRTIAEAYSIELASEVKVALASNKDHVLAVPKEKISLLMPVDLDLSTIQKLPSLNENIKAPIKRGDKVGTLELKLKNETLATVDLVANEDVDRSTILFIIDQIKSFFGLLYVQIALLVLVLLIIAYIIFSIIYNKRKRRNRYSQKFKRKL